MLPGSRIRFTTTAEYPPRNPCPNPSDGGNTRINLGYEALFSGIHDTTTQRGIGRHHPPTAGGGPAVAPAPT